MSMLKHELAAFYRTYSRIRASWKATVMRINQSFLRWEGCLTAHLSHNDGDIIRLYNLPPCLRSDLLGLRSDHAKQYVLRILSSLALSVCMPRRGRRGRRREDVRSLVNLLRSFCSLCRLLGLEHRLLEGWFRIFRLQYAPERCVCFPLSQDWLSLSVLLLATSSDDALREVEFRELRRGVLPRSATATLRRNTACRCQHITLTTCIAALTSKPVTHY